MGRHELLTTNTIAFYRCQFECRDTVTRSWGPLSCRSCPAITWSFRMKMHSPMSQGSVHTPGIWSWICPSCSVACTDMSHIEHVWDALYQCMTVGSSSRQYPVTSHSHWRRAGQHSTGHNQQPDQLYAKEMCCATWDIVVTLDTDWFSDPRPNTSVNSVYILEAHRRCDITPFMADLSPRCVCVHERLSEGVCMFWKGNKRRFYFIVCCIYQYSMFLIATRTVWLYSQSMWNP